MSYQVLARKWRPRSFEEVAGQSHVVKVLQHALTQQRLHHAYLFTGTRGVGKTTLARVLAKCLSCEGGITATPCGRCDSCLEIDEGRFIDLIEVDAASRTKVEDTRDLLDNVQYLPGRGRFKIYLIDEVHMLSGHSFNALLKTLEEPPIHVKFLLATTDPHKLPMTVLSRCIQFNLRALPPETISKQLQNILAQEKITYENEALRLLALEARGSVRDALSLLDQAISFGHGSVTTKEIQDMLGNVDGTKIMELLEELTQGNTEKILRIIDTLNTLGTDFSAAIDKILEHLHQLAVIQLSPDYASTIEDNEILIALAKKITKEDVQLYYQIALLAKRDFILSPTPKFGFEMMMLRMLAFRLETAEPMTMTKQIKVGQIKTCTETSRETTDTTKTAAEQVKVNLQSLQVTGAARALLQHCVVSKADDQEIELLLDSRQTPLLAKKHQERINAALNEYLGRQIKLTIKAGSSNMLTTDNINRTAYEKARKESLEAVYADPIAQELMDQLGAKIIEDSTDIY